MKALGRVWWMSFGALLSFLFILFAIHNHDEVVVDLLRHDRDDFRRRMGQEGFGFEPEELKSLLEAAGLEKAACHELPLEPAARGPALLLATGTRKDKP